MKLIIIGTLILINFSNCQKENNYSNQCEQKPKYLQEFELPQGLMGYNSYEYAYKCSKASNRPIAIYFGAKSCTNCKLFEEKFLYTEETIKLLNRNFVFAALSVDDKTELPIDDQKIVKSKYSGDSRLLKTIGHLNSSLVNKYSHSSHPSLFIVTPDEEIISLIQYDSNILNLEINLREVINKLDSY